VFSIWPYTGLPDLENVIVLPFVGSKDEVNLDEIPNRFLNLDLWAIIVATFYTYFSQFVGF
jgi:hypothetical protein